MNLQDKKIIQDRYKNRLRKYGANIKALASGTEARRDIRFRILTDVGIQDGDSVLDVGCGFADFFIYLKNIGINVKYTGIDIVPELIEAASNLHPALDLSVRDLQENPFPPLSFDYVICSQVFNFDFGGGKNPKLIKDMIKIMHLTAIKGVAIDFLSSYVDFKQDQLYYYQPEEVFSYAKQLTRQVSIRHDYPLFEFCIYLYPTFNGWVKKEE